MTHQIHFHRLVCFALFILLAAIARAQEKSAPPDPQTAVQTPWRVGAELDLLPYVFNGYYASGFAGHAAWRFRGVAARSDTPGFLVSSGFENKRSDAYALIFDRFLGKNRNDLRGFWVGAGPEFWRNRIRQKGTSQYTYFNTGELTAGGGYVWHLSRHFYVNPWSALHFSVVGNRSINVSGKTYHQPVAIPEASVKVGVVF